jgi:hypothetical protein
MDGVWMGFSWSMGAWDWNIAPETFHVSMGNMFEVCGCLGIETHVRAAYQIDMFQWVVCFRCLLAQASKRAVAGLESCHVSVMAIFRGLSFWHYVKPSPKHDIFWCWFVRGLALPTHQNLRQTTSKQTMHLRIVAEITSRDFTWYTFQFERPFFLGSGRRSQPPLT